MQMPFTVEQFFAVFGAYNLAIWPAQVIAYALGLLAIALAAWENNITARIISGVLALFWLWMGIAYHIVHLRTISPAAWVFGAAFVLQGLLFLVKGVISDRLAFEFRLKPQPLVGVCFILYAIAIYPLLGTYFGHFFPQAPMFGVAPCPTTIFTFGMLLWATRPVPWYLLVIPFLWSLVGMSAAINLRVPQDYGLVVAGVVGTGLILIEGWKARRLRQTQSDG